MVNQIVQDLFPKQLERINRGVCAICSKEVDESKFKDELSLKEFKISGLCQNCQDGVFN